MKIYLAATAPGNERERNLPQLIRTRLLSYFLIKEKMMENHEVFNRISDENLSGQR